MKVVHLTSAHNRYDTRIFIKQCRSLAAHGYSVSLVVADGKGGEIKDNVNIVDVGQFPGRLNRIFKTTRRVFRKAVELDANVYHLHDPELIPFGLKLKKMGKKVIFDSHEDVPADIRDKKYLSLLSRILISKIYEIYQRRAFRKFDFIVAATPFIRDKLSFINENSVDINNYPVLGELSPSSTVNWSSRKNQVCYIGSISVLRGICEIVQAMDSTINDVKLQIGGEFRNSGVEENIKNHAGWKFVEKLGLLNRGDVRSVLSRSKAGLVTLYPTVPHINSLPVKMFEYMEAGIPIIASNFPLWQKIVEENDCGLCVDPLDPKAIATAIDFIVDNPDRARAMGENGRSAVYSRFNWGVEEVKFLRLYKQISLNELGDLSTGE